MIPQPLRIGTRSSELALWQAAQVELLLTRLGIATELVRVESQGDRDLHTPLYAMGVQGVFTRQLDQALLAQEIDLAVHSLKDVPVQPAQGICLAAVLPRGKVDDVLICRDTAWIDDVRSHGTIATGSIRRRAAWLHRYPYHQIADFRGNIPTRMRKFRESSWQGALFARAALERLRIELREGEQMVPLPWMIPAPGQGAIAVAAREQDADLLELCASGLNDPDTALCVSIERNFLKALEGGCSTPICAYARLEDQKLIFTAQVLSADGHQQLDVHLEKPKQAGTEVAQEAAEILLAKGARKLLRNFSH